LSDYWIDLCYATDTLDRYALLRSNTGDAKMTHGQNEQLPEKITFYLATLRDPLQAYCDKTGESPSRVVRKSLAKLLKVYIPSVQAGNPQIAEQNKARA